MARFVARCAMRWSDMDAYGHVNNTAYLAYLEQARVSMFFDRHDPSFASGTVVKHHEITYLRPVVYHPEPLRLELWVDQIRAASFRVLYDVYDRETLAATASTTLVAFDFDHDRPRRITPEERAILVGFADDRFSGEDDIAGASGSGSRAEPGRDGGAGGAAHAGGAADPGGAGAVRGPRVGDAAVDGQS